MAEKQWFRSSALRRMLIRINPDDRAMFGIGRNLSADVLNAPVADVMNLALQDIFVLLDAADFLRAALACKTWRHAAACSIPPFPVWPLLGYFFHPKAPAMPPPMPTDSTHHPAVFFPLDAAASSAQLISLDFTPYDITRFSIHDVYHGIVLLLPHSSHSSRSMFPRFLAVDPASRRHVMPSSLPPSLHDAPEPCFIGAAVLNRVHPSKLSFDVVYVVVYGNRRRDWDTHAWVPRAWVASFIDGEFVGWCASPRTEGVVLDFDPSWLEQRCVHAAGNLYWHISDCTRVLQLNPCTLEFSFLTVPDALDDLFAAARYRIGESPEDGSLCVASIADDETLQIWVRRLYRRFPGVMNNRGWFLEMEFMLSHLFDAVPGLPKDKFMRSIWLSDLDYFPRTGKVFIGTKGYGRYSVHLKTGKLERLVLEDGKEHGDPIYAYALVWPPEFLIAPPTSRKKAVHKTTTTNDKRLQSTLKRIGMNNIPAIEEVNIFKDDAVIQFQYPKVQESIRANTWVISGVPQTKSLQDLLPSIINQLGPDNLDNLKRLPEAGTGAAAQDDDVPELVPGETFEEAAVEEKN